VISIESHCIPQWKKKSIFRCLPFPFGWTECTCSHLLLACQNLTYGNGFHNANGGPDRAINISEDMRRDLKVVQTRFIQLNPRSHSAVFTGIVSIKFITCFNSIGITFPALPLYSDKHFWPHWNSGQNSKHSMHATAYRNVATYKMWSSIVCWHLVSAGGVAVQVLPAIP